jgi:hypothetical protein
MVIYVLHPEYWSHTKCGKAYSPILPSSRGDGVSPRRFAHVASLRAVPVGSPRRAGRYVYGVCHMRAAGA